MLDLPSRFTAVRGVGNLVDPSEVDDYRPSPERWLAFHYALVESDEQTREGLARDRNLRLGSAVVLVDQRI